MTFSTGFSDVDASARAPELVDYLGHAARHVTAMRSQDYARLGLEPGHAVLDVGCGAGDVCVELAGRVGPSGRVCGVDVSEAMVAAARAAADKAGREVDLRVASAYSLPFADASFDAVRAERVFQHLDDPARALAEMVRVTRPGGRILVFDPDHSQHSVSLENDLQCRVHEATRSALLRMIVNPRIGTRLPGPGAIYVSQTLRFLAPVKIGDTVEATVEVVALDDKRRRAELACRCAVGATLVLEGEAVVKVPRRGEG